MIRTTERRTAACTRRCSDLGPGRPCPECGHWSGVHPGVHNTSLDECLLCALELQIAEASQAAQGQRLAFTVRELADMTRISFQTIYREIDAGNLRTKRVRGRIVIPVKAAEEWLRTDG